MKRGSMQSKIPPAIREQLAEDPFMKTCIIKSGGHEGRIEWNHAFTYAGRRRNELYFLLPMCSLHHRQESAWRETIAEYIRFRIKHFHAEDDFRAKYPKSNLIPPKVEVK